MHKIRTVVQIFKMMKNPVPYLYDYFFNHVEKTYTFKNGMKIALGTREDRLFFHEIWIHKIYTREFDIEEDDIVVDVGAQRGMFSLYASMKAKRVYSFEPLPSTFKILQSNVEINNIKNITPVKLALTDRKSVMKLHIHESHSGSHTLYDHYGKGKTVSVKTTTLQDFMQKNKIGKIDFLKMDCEGAEYDILFNLPLDILRRIRKISMEYHDGFTQRNHEDIARLLRNNGFRVYLYENFTVISALNKCKPTKKSRHKKAPRADRLVGAI